MRSRAATLWLIAGAFALTRCAGQPHVTRVAGASPSLAHEDTAACEQAREQRQRIAGLLTHGRLDRALRVIERADELCVEDSPKSWAQEVLTLAQVGRYAEAARLADVIDASPAASPEARQRAKEARALVALGRDSARTQAAAIAMRAQLAAAKEAEDRGDHANAKELFLRAWDQLHPNGDALFGAGMAVKRAGETAEAQRLFDRAVEDYKRQHGASAVRLEVPNGFQFRDAHWIWDNFHSVAWSPDGSLLASNDQNDIVLFDTRTWRPTRRLVGHTGWVFDLAFSPDGKLLASAGEDAVRVWALDSSTPPVTFAGAAGPLAFSPDGKTLAWASTWSDDSPWFGATEVYLWMVGSTQPPRVLTTNGGKLGFLRGGRILVTGNQLWQLDGPEPLVGITPPALNGTTLLAASPDGETMAVLTARRADVWRLALWRLGAKTLMPLPRHDFFRAGHEAAFAPDGKALAFVNERGTEDAGPIGGDLELWTLRPKPRFRLLDRAFLHSLAFSPDGKMLAGGWRGDHATVWTLSPKAARRDVGVAPAAEVSSVAVSEDGSMVAWGSDDATVHAWPLISTGVPRAFDVVDEDVSGNSQSAVTFSPDAKTLVWLRRIVLAHAPRPIEKHVATFWNIGSTAEPAAVEASDTTISADGRTGGLASPNGVEIGTLPARVLSLLDENPASMVAMSPDGHTLTAWSQDQLVARTWSLGSNHPPNLVVLFSWSDLPRTCSADRQIFALKAGTQILLWLHALTPPGDWPDCAAIGSMPHMGVPEMKSPASIVLDGATQGLLPVGESANVGMGQDRDYTVLAFTSDDRFIVSAGSDGAVDFWSLSTRRIALSLHAVRAPSRAAYAVTPDGHVALFGDDARQYALCRIGDFYYPIDLCEERFVVPDLVSKVVSGDESYQEP